MIDEKQLHEKLRVMEVVEKELEKQKKDSIFCLLVFTSSISLWVLLVALWEELDKPIAETMMTNGVEIIAILMLIIILKFTRLDIRKMGLTSKGIRVSLIRAGIISAAIVGIMIGLKIILKPDEPLFFWEFYDFRYPFVSVIQEFLARGFLVTTLVRIIPSKWKRHIAVVCSSLMFTTLHLYYGFNYMLTAGILSLILGYIFLKDDNIWGVSLIHYVIGSFGVVLCFV